MNALKISTCAAALLLAGAVVSAQQADKSPAGQKLEQLANQQVDSKTTGEVRTAVAQLVNNALAEGKFPALLSQLAKADRDRIGEMPREDYAELHKAIGQFRESFHARYNRDFAFTADHLKTLELTRSPQAKIFIATLKPLPKPAEGDRLVSPGVVSGPTISLVQEGSDETPMWKLDIPNEMNGRQLKVTLARRLQKLADEKAAWPEDPAAVYQSAANEVFQALQEPAVARDDN